MLCVLREECGGTADNRWKIDMRKNNLFVYTYTLQNALKESGKHRKRRTNYPLAAVVKPYPSVYLYMIRGDIPDIRI